MVWLIGGYLVPIYFKANSKSIVVILLARYRKNCAEQISRSALFCAFLNIFSLNLFIQISRILFSSNPFFNSLFELFCFFSFSYLNINFQFNLTTIVVSLCSISFSLSLSLFIACVTWKDDVFFASRKNNNSEKIMVMGRFFLSIKWI